MTDTPANILVIDDEEAVCWALQRALSREGHAVAVAASAEAGFTQAGRLPPDVVVLDVRLPGLDGLSALPRLRELAPKAAFIVITAFGNLQTAVRAVEGGAFDYLTKPFDLTAALDVVHRALSRREPPPAPPPVTDDEMVGAGPAMQAVFKRIALVAPGDACVLITGESGTGKELVARAIHRYGSRRDKPFLPVHVAALNANLVESELFGHERGAFTGATGPKPGLLALADGGTVFLDELAEIPPAVQVKLLRALEHGEVMPVGGRQPIRVNLRILAATHQDLSACVADGRFRLDLYYRLNVFGIHLPPLRDRPDDIAPLAEHFLRKFRPSALPLTAETLSYLKRQPWTGNVRELRNALEHAAILAREGELRPEHFPTPTPAAQGATLPELVRAWVDERVRAAGEEPPSGMYDELLGVIEPALLEEVMRRLRGNRLVAGQWLGLNRATVRKKLTAYGLAEVDGEEEE